MSRRTHIDQLTHRVVLDWRDGQHFNHRGPAPCRCCGGLASCLDEHGKPCHKTCREAELTAELDRQLAAAIPAEARTPATPQPAPQAPDPRYRQALVERYTPAGPAAGGDASGEGAVVCRAVAAATRTTTTTADGGNPR